MPRVLLTAYGPYDDWRENTSWLVLQEVLRIVGPSEGLVTRLYPVDFAEVRRRIAADVAGGINVAIHLGQAPGRAQVELEAIGLNVARERRQRGDEAVPLVPGGPPALASTLPLADWARDLRTRGLPADVSHYAGTYLCNAALYLSQYHGARATFLHLPMATEHVLREDRSVASLPLGLLAEGVGAIVGRVVGETGVAPLA